MKLRVGDFVKIPLSERGAAFGGGKTLYGLVYANQNPSFGTSVKIVWDDDAISGETEDAIEKGKMAIVSPDVVSVEMLLAFMEILSRRGELR